LGHNCEQLSSLRPGTRPPECDISIGAVSLVIQRGPERAWDWNIVSTIRFAASART
jgi:hypothetical protein